MFSFVTGINLNFPSENLHPHPHTSLLPYPHASLSLCHAHRACILNVNLLVSYCKNRGNHSTSKHNGHGDDYIQHCSLLSVHTDPCVLRLRFLPGTRGRNMLSLLLSICICMCTCTIFYEVQSQLPQRDRVCCYFLSISLIRIICLITLFDSRKLLRNSGNLSYSLNRR